MDGSIKLDPEDRCVLLLDGILQADAKKRRR